MGTFEITRARQQLGFTPATSAHANIDVRGTGGSGAAMGQALVAGLELKKGYDTKVANTELSEYQRNVGLDDVQLDTDIRAELDPSKHPEIYKRHAETRKGLMPKSRIGNQAATLWNNIQEPKYAKSLVDGMNKTADDNWLTEYSKQLSKINQGLGGIEDTKLYIARRQFGPDPLPNSVAAKLLAEATTADSVGNITNLYRTGDYAGARKATEESSLDITKKESMINTINASESRAGSASDKAANAAIETAYGDIRDGIGSIDSMLDAIAIDPTISDKDSNEAAVKIRTFFTTWNSLVKKDVVTDNPTRIAALKIKGKVASGNITLDAGLAEYAKLETETNKINRTDNKDFISQIFSASDSAAETKNRRFSDMVSEREKRVRDNIERQPSLFPAEEIEEILKDFANMAVIKFNDRIRDEEKNEQFGRNEVDELADSLMIKYTLSEGTKLRAVSARRAIVAESIEKQQEEIIKVAASYRQEGKTEDAKAVMDEAITLGLFNDDGTTVKKKKGGKKVGGLERILKRVMDSW